MKQVAEVECELNRLNTLTDHLSEELSGLKSELEKANEEYKRLHAEHCLIKDNMLHQEDERQKAFDYFFEQESKVMALEKEIEELTKEKTNLVLKNEEARALGEKLHKKILSKEDSIEELDTKIAGIKQKQVCVSKKISKAETLIKHLVANSSLIIAAGNN